MPVSFTISGFVAGNVTGYKTAIGGKKSQRLPFWALNNSWPFVLIIQNQKGVVAMRAINPTTGPFTAATVSALLPVLQLSTIALQSAQDTTLRQQATATGLIIWRGAYPIAWIYPGYHNGKSALKPKHCEFVDVAYHRQTQRGVNLETVDFDDLEQALEFIAETFGAVVGGAA